jgi:outer membrane protein assembly factor BamB
LLPLRGELALRTLKNVLPVLAVLLLLFGSLVSAEKPAAEGTNWPQWRGPLGTGVSPSGNPALEWSETKNVRWKVALPGRGHSTPIIWGDMMFLTTAIEAGPAESRDQSAVEQQRRGGPPSRKPSNIFKFVVMALNRQDGKILWQKTVNEERPHEATHEFGSWASASAVTDGGHVYAYFGSYGLYCLDMKGNLKWERDFGNMSKHMEFGEGSSPALYGDKILVLWDHEGDSFLYAIDKNTGKDAWKVARDEGTSWSTPVVLEINGAPQVVTSATNRVRSYDLATGKLIWECGGLTRNVIPIPVYADGLLYVMSGFRGNALLAIRIADAKGDITDTDVIAWKHNRDTPYTPSPVLVNNRLYFLRSNNGIISCFDAKTGKPLYGKQRLEGMGNIFTSPVAAKGRIYVMGQNGTTYVVKEGPEFGILAKNKLEDQFHASPVIVGDLMYLRGFENLYCIEEK